MAKCKGVQPRKKLGKNKDSGVRNIRHRAVPCHKDIYDGMDRLAMVCNIIWNVIRYQKVCEYRGRREDETYTPDHSSSDFNRRFMELKAQPSFA